MKNIFFIKFIQIKLIQYVLNLNANLRQLSYILLCFNFFLVLTLFGLWTIFPNYLKIATYCFIISIIFLYAFLIKKKINLISVNQTILWIEKNNSLNKNPILAVLDLPINVNYNKALWALHKKQSILSFKKIIYKFPTISFNLIDPLKIRFIFILGLLISFYWAYQNNKIEKNIFSFFLLEKKNLINEKQFKLVAWVSPPSYTGLRQKEINLQKLNPDEESNIVVPDGTELFMHISSSEKQFKIVESNKKIPFIQNEKNNYKLNYKIERTQDLDIYKNAIFMKRLKFTVIKDKQPSIKFLSIPEVINNASIKFSSQAKDDYGIKIVEVLVLKPKKFKHFIEQELKFELNLNESKNKKEIINYFYKRFSDHIWAGALSKIEVLAFDGIGQKAIVGFDLKLPKRNFKDPTAKKILKYRNAVALKKIKTQIAAKKLDKLIKENSNLIKNLSIKEQAKIVVIDLEKEKVAPNISTHVLYKKMWDLAVMIEEGQFYLANKNLEQVEQNLFDSINQKETDKISANVERMKESLKSLLDMEKNSSNDKNKFKEKKNDNLTNQLDNITKEIEDLLKTGSKEQLNNKIQKLKQLSEALKNKSNLGDEEMLKQENTEKIINKLSELLNEQEEVMEESFNLASNRGKFEQSSEGSGGKSPKEKQENLRNTLGNIMREIGASENEIPQELGRADRAMRQASRDLENGRPDRASNAQGRAIEMIQRSMNRMNYQEANQQQKYNKAEKEDYGTDPNNNTLAEEKNMEYSGTLMGGNIEIPEKLKIRKAKKIADELYNRYNENKRNSEEKKYIRKLLDWY